MNKGLKEVYNQIEDSEGIIDYKLNLYNQDNNLFINISLFNTLNKNINLSLLYNHQNKLSLYDCGKGFSLNCYMHLDGDSINPYLVEADKTTSLLSSYYTSIIDKRTYDLTFYEDDDNPSVCDLTINDFDSNEIFMITQKNYPNYINLRNGYQILFDFDQYNKLIKIKDSINNTIFDKLEFTYLSNSNLISKIEYKNKSNYLMNYAEFTYDNNSNLIQITYKNHLNNELSRIEITYNSNNTLFQIKNGNNIINEFKYYFNNSYITKIENIYGTKYEFTYHNDYTVVSDKYNNVVEYYFKDNKLSYVKDSHSNITYYEYDMYDRIIFNVDNINILDNFNNSLPGNYNYYSFNLNNDSKYLLLVKTTSNTLITLKGTIYSNSNEDDEYVYDYIYVNGLKILILDVYDYNEITISNTSNIEKIMLFENKDYIKVEYNNKSKITKIGNKFNNIINTYNLYNELATSSNYLLTKEYSYNNSNHHLLTKVEYEDYEKNYTYDSNNNLIFEDDDLKNKTYEYYLDNMIKKDIIDSNHYEEYHYDNYNKLITTEKKNSDRLLNIDYTYDNYDRLIDSEATINNINYEIIKEYTNNNKSKDKLKYYDNNIEKTEEFNYQYSNNLLTSVYYYNDDILNITYSSDRITSIESFGISKNFNYDINNRLININNETYFSYDNYNRLSFITHNNVVNYRYYYDINNNINYIQNGNSHNYINYDKSNELRTNRCKALNNSIDLLYLKQDSIERKIIKFIKKNHNHDLILFDNNLISEEGLKPITYKDDFIKINGITYTNSRAVYRLYNENTIVILAKCIIDSSHVISLYKNSDEFGIYYYNNKFILKYLNNVITTNQSALSINTIYISIQKLIDDNGEDEIEYLSISFNINGNEYNYYQYDYSNSISYINLSIDSKTSFLTYSYIYESYNMLNNYEIIDYVYDYDQYGRISTNLIGSNLELSYTYTANSFFDSVTIKDNTNHIKFHSNVLYNSRYEIESYEYHFNNETSGYQMNYSYDNFNRLIREYRQGEFDTPVNTYEYYMNGDIKKVNNNVYNYTNGLLTSINNNQLTYTNTYFLHTYLGKTYNFTNERLTSFIDSNNNTYYYEYNYRGLRTRKTFNNNVINYFYDDKDRLILEQRGNIRIYYIYILDELIGFMYNNNVYYYAKDIEKRIVGIISGSTVVARYQYSAYGVIIYCDEASVISGINKFLYKSYYYDEESNMYYLKNRYYSLDILRFISPDNYNYLNLENHTNYNLYAYCNNNPIINYDPEGNFVIELLFSIALFYGTSYIVGKIEYAAWNNLGWIKYDINGNIEIKNSWIINNPISQIAFLDSIQKKGNPNSKGIKNKRNILNLSFEWQLHNVAAVIGKIGAIITFFPSLLTSNGTIYKIFNSMYNRGKDVYLDNDEDWWKKW